MADVRPFRALHYAGDDAQAVEAAGVDQLARLVAASRAGGRHHAVRQLAQAGVVQHPAVGGHGVGDHLGGCRAARGRDDELEEHGRNRPASARGAGGDGGPEDVAEVLGRVERMGGQAVPDLAGDPSHERVDGGHVDGRVIGTSSPLGWNAGRRSV